jgi:hypothetical protein
LVVYAFGYRNTWIRTGNVASSHDIKFGQGEGIPSLVNLHSAYSNLDDAMVDGVVVTDDGE